VGDDGVGKSTIGQSFAEWCVERDLLGASFFFSRACDVSYHRAHQMFPTIAYQLAEHIPSSRSLMNNVVLRDPVSIKGAIDVQLQKLIAEPLLSSEQVGKSRKIVVIDGLDEFPGVPLLRRIVTLISDVLKTHPSLPLRFLVTAKTHNLNSAILALPRIRCLRLEGPFAAAEQIRIFLQAELQEKIPSLTSMQPSPIDKLLQRSSGQFVYASALVGFLADELHDAKERLERIISWEDVPVGSSELNTLYLHILRGATLDEKLLVQILSLVVRCPSHIESFSKLVDLPPRDIILLLRNVRPVVHLPDPDAFQLSHKIHVRHMTFINFLTDKARANSFFLDEGMSLGTDASTTAHSGITDKLSHSYVMKISRFSFDGKLRKALSNMGIKRMPDLKPPKSFFQSF
jgi:hypothetical protein